jgi:hypothetical protein
MLAVWQAFAFLVRPAGRCTIANESVDRNAIGCARIKIEYNSMEIGIKTVFELEEWILNGMIMA